MSMITLKLPLCDVCGKPWLPEEGPARDNPRAYDAAQRIKTGGKPMRCGKCKSPAWDKKYAEEMKRKVRASLSSTKTQRGARLADEKIERLKTTKIVINPARLGPALVHVPLESLDLVVSEPMIVECPAVPEEIFDFHAKLKAQIEVIAGATGLIRCRHGLIKCSVCEGA